MQLDRVALLVFALLLALRLFGAVEWSWGFVLLPLAMFLGGLRPQLRMWKS